MRSPVLLSVLLLAVTGGACGQSLTPNTTGTGGFPTGAGDFMGTGGVVSGAGGTGGAITGSGGSSAGPSICNTLISEYQSTLAAAVTCTVGASGQCQGVVSPSLVGCGCTVVNDASALGAIEMTFQAEGCATSVPPCLASCVSPASYSCVSTDGGSSGVCSYGVGSGGVAGTGGFSDTGGTTGAGGVTGSGGATGSRGVTGSGGSSGDGGVDCATLAAEYAAVMVGARTCTPGASGQCGQTVPASLSPCTTGCVDLVTDSSVLDVLSREWQAAGCAEVPTSCPRIACPPGVTATCVTTDAGDSYCATSPQPIISTE